MDFKHEKQRDKINQLKLWFFLKILAIFLLIGLQIWVFCTIWFLAIFLMFLVVPAIGKIGFSALMESLGDINGYLEKLNQFESFVKKAKNDSSVNLYDLLIFADTQIYYWYPRLDEKDIDILVDIYKKKLYENKLVIKEKPLPDKIHPTFSEKVKNITVQYLSEYAEKNNFRHYSLVDITKSSFTPCKIGRYFYAIDNQKNLHLLYLPIIIEEECIMVAPNLIDKEIEINREFIKDFQLFGSQLMKSSVVSENNKQSPRLLKTMFSELLFGSAYTLLKGLNHVNIGTTHSVEDLRSVQMILEDNSDIEFSGIQIFYDLNRFYGVAKNNEESIIRLEKEKVSRIKSAVESDNRIAPPNNTINNGNRDCIQKLKEAKELLECNLISQEEFDKLKAGILEE